MTEKSPSPGQSISLAVPRVRQEGVHPATVRHTAEVRHDGRLYTVEVPRLRVPRCKACGELVFENGADEEDAAASANSLVCFPANRFEQTANSWA